MPTHTIQLQISESLGYEENYLYIKTKCFDANGIPSKNCKPTIKVNDKRLVGSHMTNHLGESVISFHAKEAREYTIVATIHEQGEEKVSVSKVYTNILDQKLGWWLAKNNFDFNLGHKSFHDGALSKACENGNEHIVNGLMYYGVHPDSTCNPKLKPLHLAVFFDHIGIISTLLSHGANANSNDEKRDTPLHIAAEIGSPQSIILLLQHNANIKAQGYYRDTPVQRAKASNHLELVKILIDAEGKY